MAAKRKVKKEPFPWGPLLLLLLTVGLFWLVPRQRGTPPVEVEFTPAASKP